MGGKRVLVGMSGGVDSLVAAALLKTQGYDVTGVHIQVWDGPSVMKPTGGNCSLNLDLSMLKTMCTRLEIPLHISKLKDQFEQEVLDYVVHDSLRARTPNPCVQCTGKLKFRHLIQKADELKCDFVATGHYAKIVRNTDGSETNLYKAVDKQRDQSYFLFGLPQAYLARALMPLGDLIKTNVIKMAYTFGIPVESPFEDEAGKKKKDPEICLIGEGGYQELVVSRSSDRFRLPGPIVDQEGHALGRHTGLYKYRLGQHPIPGLTKPEHKELFVIGFDIKLCAVIVGPAEELKRSSLLALNCNWIGLQDFSKGISAKARIRPWEPESECMVTLLNSNSVLVDFKEPQQTITPGQAIVFYQEDLVLGGGWIESPTNPVITKLRPKEGSF